MAGRSVRNFLADLGYTVHTASSVFGRERLLETLHDEDWLALAGLRGWVVFCRDQHIMDRPAELQAYLDAKVHMFMLPGSALRDHILELLGSNLAEICSLASARRPGVYWLMPQKVVSYERRRAELNRKRRKPTT
ncbi:hypothetical protein [Actinoplanes sp. NPDC051859]|uniref:PIN-like domain-containing protein n=1 Tax=Actinoplanes sp. NPDC051859 TaxID=3363909 RepID=UPI0037ACC85C